VAFDDLANIVVKMEGFGLSREDSKLLQSSVASGNDYIKNYFPFHIKWHSKTKTHCASWALSEEPNELMRVDCTEPHDEDCSFCLNIPKIKCSLLGALEMLVDLPEKEKEKLAYGIKTADEAIKNYKNHLFRAYAQNSTWEDMIKSKPTDTVFMHIDWAMNFVPTENRESILRWFGKAVR
jgi:hypothetical protein